MQVMNCWPTKWLEAAEIAKLAIYKGDGEWHFRNDSMRDLLGELGEFATSIIEHAVMVEREECASIAERWGETHVAAVTVNARDAGEKIARGIRKRSNLK